MPRFSVIVPVFKVQGFLRECLDSVLGQSFADLEVIAVDDCSPDGCGAILDEYAARDPRLKAVHLPENVGLGRARNAGLPHATGDYVLFLDSDDRYTPGLLRAVADRLDATRDPDILVFDHVRTHWWGRAGRSDAAGLLEQAGAGAFAVREHPEYLRLFLVAWNKAYRRDFFVGHGFQYRPGLYEDAPVTYQTMVTAERIACLDRVGVEYRQRRQGAITRTPGRRHFDIFEQYEGLFAYLAERPGLDWARPLLFERALDHMLFAVARPERVLRGDRKEFYRRIRAFYRRHVPPGFVPPPDSRRAEIRLLGLAPYHRAHLGLGLWRRGSLAAGRRAARLREALARQVRRCWYRLQLRLPLDSSLAVYSAGHSRAVTGDPLAVQERAAELAPHVRGVWVVHPDAVDRVPPGTDFVTTGSWRYYRVMARAKHWVNDCNWAGDLVKRRGSVHVQTHRGTPLKYMALDLLDRPGARHGADVRGMLRRSDRWDVSLVANRHSEEVWQRAYPCHFASLRSGSPRNDVLVRGGDGRGARLRARLGVEASETVVLYAPTPRDYRKGRHVWRVDLENLAASLAPGHRLLVRLHPGLARHHERALVLRDLHRRGALIDVTDERHVEDVLLAADALVTDYSALMFDYALLDRPIVVHADDWAAYRAARGAYFDITAEPPGHVTRSDEELVKTFTSGAWRDAESARLRAAFRERFCEFDDGRAAERVVRRVLLGEAPGTAGGDDAGAVVRIPGAAGRSARLPEYS
ncbi:bifunctional glycosyltransferase family 2 protein/CDP-glycerol:glycerophosphate glycerophosphotransferase [Streptomyces sp. NBC_00704]|uniref:bifunctional glycosyltransferase/CDP-glycerol:glycerophosphate glycerophosphotransferase n=1 Tax=Streptomyces sp. NBC_00704 TaxID=2975809 RepID=UPI002E2EAE26|nr:bifunctional glycosyltransferase family 2 protein/CDP-glycerol:glycerophosphate glycerophosphotransferase [Streptomyces sp. NBC_00704]